jgi:hypothetical protein
MVKWISWKSETNLEEWFLKNLDNVLVKVNSGSRMNQEQLDNSADLSCDKLLKTFQTLGKIQHDIYKYMLLWLSLENKTH